MIGVKREELIHKTAELERMRDILSMGLTDAHEVSVSLVSVGITPETLFR